MAVYGTISEFSSAQETWTSYIERLEQYLAANKVEDADQQRAINPTQCLRPSNLQAYPQFGIPQEADRAEIPGHCGLCHKAS